MNTFFAFELDSQFKAELSTLIQRSVQILNDKKSVNWVSEEKLHLTLLYVGETRIEDVKLLSPQIKTIVSKYGTMHISDMRIEVFPPGNPRLIWVKADKFSPRIQELRNSIKSLFSKQGYEVDQRNFKAHITLGRIKRKVEDVFLKKLEKIEIKTELITLQDISFYTTGSIYHLLDAYSLD